MVSQTLTVQQMVVFQYSESRNPDGVQPRVLCEDQPRLPDHAQGLRQDLLHSGVEWHCPHVTVSSFSEHDRFGDYDFLEYILDVKEEINFTTDLNKLNQLKH
jgi:hypothetical protein